jgi:hypothetical protein
MHCYVPGSLCQATPENQLKSSNGDVSYTGQLVPYSQYKTTSFLCIHRIKVQLIQHALTIHIALDVILFVNFFQSELAEVWIWLSRVHLLSSSVLPFFYSLLELVKLVFLLVLYQFYLSTASYSFK